MNRIFGKKPILPVILSLMAFAIMAMADVSAAPGVISTVAGRFGSGFSGDGGDARFARVSHFETLAFDSKGDLIFADRFNHRIRSIDGVSGIVTTICGDGTATSAGDGGLAVDAKAHTPEGLVIDVNDNIYFSEPISHRVRRIDSITNIVTTIAGTGVAGYSGDGGVASIAQLNRPGALAVDGAGNLFIVDGSNSAVRRIDAVTNVITTIAGGGGAAVTVDGEVGTETILRFPVGVAADSEGNVFISELVGARVRRVDAGTGIVSTVLGTGETGYNGDGKEGPETQIAFPEGLTFREGGRLYLSEGMGRVRALDLNTGLVSPVAGLLSFSDAGPDGGFATMTQLRGPGSVAFDSAGNAYFPDDAKIRKIEAGEFRPVYQPDFAIGTKVKDMIGLNRFSSRGVNQIFHSPLTGLRGRTISLRLVNRSTSNDIVNFSIFGVNRFIQTVYYFPQESTTVFPISAQSRSFALASDGAVNIQARFYSKVKRVRSIRETYTYVVRSLADPSKIDVGKLRVSGDTRR